MSEDNEDYLLLKWGTLKGWLMKSEQNNKSFEILQRYLDGGVSLSAMMQRDTEEQKRLLCEVIDAFEGDIQSDWSGEHLSKDAAKEYVMSYGQ